MKQTSTTQQTQKKWAALFAIIGWFALFSDYTLLIGNNGNLTFFESTVKFFSFFTVLTNTLVAVYFSAVATRKSIVKSIFNKPGLLTAITVYITVVGLVFNIVLRPLTHLHGIAEINNEIFHTIMPLCVIWFWFRHEHFAPENIIFTVGKWMIYPLLYALYTLIHGSISGFYPYPFVDVTTLGTQAVLINMGVLIVVFIVMMLLYIGGAIMLKRKRS